MIDYIVQKLTGGSRLLDEPGLGVLLFDLSLSAGQSNSAKEGM